MLVVYSDEINLHKSNRRSIVADLMDEAAYGVIKRPQKREFLASCAGKRGHHSCPA